MGFGSDRVTFLSSADWNLRLQGPFRYLVRQVTPAEVWTASLGQVRIQLNLERVGVRARPVCGRLDP